MTQHPDLFRRRYRLRGKLWLKEVDPEDRLVFSRLGHQALRERRVPLHRLGGLARVSDRCPRCGRFQKKGHRHVHDLDSRGHSEYSEPDGGDELPF